ncbi:phosphatidylserine decarboxylase family protein [Curtobacterium sp. RRHDQ10]|uniref:phosphatidylserine decarboxylase family protein n=1 Tax=Curtobacterium phyllosphaerae TaxID=3413379 RepID=UPI003BF0D2E1
MTDDRGGDFRRQGGWLPTQDELERWIEGRRDSLPEHGDRELRPSVRAFADIVDHDPVLRMLAVRMIDEVPPSKPYRKQHVGSFDELVRLVDDVVRSAPAFGEGSMVSTPLAAVLDWTMATPSGFAFYRDPRVNRAMGAVLDEWREFLDGPGSLEVLHDGPDGWMSPEARRVVGIDDFEHDPDAEHWGFSSWNDFFTRAFRPGARPVEAPDDDDVVTSACESTPYRIARDVQRHDEFWIKSQPYSLEDMLAHDDSVEQFVGGTVYQAFLSATNYHRWHSPVRGTVRRAFVQSGTYFSEADSEGSAARQPPESQGYLAHVAARAIVVIDADNPALGTVGFVAVGMIDVSSCVIRDGLEGMHVDKGEELGEFRFGGSTHCLVFEPGAVDAFDVDAIPAGSSSSLVRLGRRIATARHDRHE